MKRSKNLQTLFKQGRTDVYTYIHTYIHSGMYVAMLLYVINYGAFYICVFSQIKC